MKKGSDFFYDVIPQSKEEPKVHRNISEYIQELSKHSNDFYQHLEMESQYVDTYQDISYPSASVQLHSHRFYELIFCRNARGVEYLVGSERYKLQNGDLVIVAPGTSHCPILTSEVTEPYVRYILWLSEDFMTLLNQHFPDSHLLRPSSTTLLRTAGTRWEYIGNLFRVGVMETENKQFGWEVAVMANTLSILTHLFRANMDTQSRPLVAEKAELLDQVLAYIEQSMSEKLTLADVAKHFFISESTITQTFRKKMGISFYRYVTQRRLISAKALMEKGASLESIAEQVGFSDYSSFFRAFKQEYGVSPRQYRKKAPFQEGRG